MQCSHEMNKVREDIKEMLLQGKKRDIASKHSFLRKQVVDHMDKKTKEIVLRDVESVDNDTFDETMLSKSVSFKISTLQQSRGDTPKRENNDSNMFSNEMAN